MALVAKNLLVNIGDERDPVSILGLEDPWRAWQPTPVFLPGESHRQRSLAGYSPKGCKQSDTVEPLGTHKTSSLRRSDCPLVT